LRLPGSAGLGSIPDIAGSVSNMAGPCACRNRVLWPYFYGVRFSQTA